VLDELATCYESLPSQSQEVSESFGVIFELILSFVARPSALFRTLGEQVFATFASAITQASLDSMFDVLAKKESLSGQQDLFDEGAAEVSGSDDEDDEDLDSDVEMIDGSAESHESGSSSGGEGEDEDSEDEGDDDELETFNKLLAQTLKTSRPGEAGQDEESSDEDMDDEQMMELEPHLTKIFQERRKASSKKKDQKNARETIINFKNRVLDLLQILVLQQHDKAICLQTIVPILALMRTTNTKQLSEKSANLLKQYFEKSKNKGLPTEASQEELSNHLTQVHEEVVKGGSKHFVGTCSRASLFLAKIIVAAEPNSFKTAVQQYSSTQERWLLANACGLQQSFFLEWFEWCKTLKGAKKSKA
jgi:DNA polymerase phi